MEMSNMDDTIKILTKKIEEIALSTEQLMNESNDLLTKTEQPITKEQTTEQEPEIDNKLLIPFLRSLADELENGTIKEETRVLVGEFYMNLSFKKELKTNVLSENDMSKFLVLGWYIYSNILKKTSDEGNDVDEGDDDELDKYIDNYINSID
jgi:hypothetical protein